MEYIINNISRHANWRRKPDRFIDEVWAGVKAVPSKEVVKRHVDWYAEYCARRDKQKEKIGQWRKSKVENKLLERKPTSSSINLHKTTKSNWLQKNKEKLKRLEEWKRLKTVKKEIEEAEELLRIAEKKSKIELRMERRNQQIKKYLKIREEKKRQQQEKEEEMKRIKEMQIKQRREINRMVLSQYHDKDMERIQLKIKQKSEEQAKREEQKRQQLEKLTRPVLARREIDNIFKGTVASTNREKATKEKINLLFPPSQKPPIERGKSDMCADFIRRRSLDGGDLYHLDNLPRLGSAQWRTLV